MTLRDYQLTSEQAAFNAWREGYRCIAGRMFTGGGKTIVFSSISAKVVKEFPDKCVMILAHRRELIWQAVDKMKRCTNLSVEVEMGEYKAAVDKNLFHPRSNVIVSTVQTHVAGGDGGGRISKFDPEDFQLLIIDECHRAVSPSYRKAIDYYMTNPRLWVLGVTATPDRADEKALGQAFETVPDGFDYDMNYGRVNGWLAEVDQQEVSIDGLDFSEIRTSADDLNSADLAAVMEKEKPLYGIADATIKISGDRRGLGFAPSVNYARMMASIFNRYRPGMAAFIHGGTDKEERRKINADFAAGKIQWIWNCGTHTEGFDDCGIEVVVPKPTCSRSLYEQMLGRGGRVHDSIAGLLGNVKVPALRRGMVARSCKPSFLVLDFYGNSGKHKLVTSFDILGGDMSPDAIVAAKEESRRSGQAIRVSKTLEEQEKQQAEAKARQSVEDARKCKLTATATYKTRSIDAFDVLQVKPIAKRGWDEGKILSERQREVLRKAGLDPDKMEYHRAKQLVSIMIERWKTKKCSIKQVNLLKRFGYEAQEWGQERAKKTIDAIAKNGWQRPEHFEASDLEPIGLRASLEDDNIPF